MIAKIYLEGDKIVFEALAEDDIPDKICLSKNGRLGVVVCDTKNNLGITKEAVKVLKNIIKRADKCNDDLNVLDWWKCTDNTYALSWMGNNKIVVPQNIKIEVNKNMEFIEDGYIEL